MGGALDISVTGLNAFRTALNTVSNNIANANTEGYSRQEIQISSLPPQVIGGNFVGSGSFVSDIKRIESSFLTSQVRVATSESQRLNTFNTQSSRVDNLLGDSEGSLSPSLQNFFNSLQDLSNDATSSSARQVVLSSGESLVNRFQNIENQLASVDRDIDNEIKNSIREVNSIATNIADLNEKIIEAQNFVLGDQQPNELLDQRDQLLLELSKFVAVQTVEQQNGSFNVFIGTGQSLVIGGVAQELLAIRNEADSQQTQIAFIAGSTQSDITSQVTGGSLSGLIDFRDQQLGSIRNELGRIATVLAGTFNEQHRSGQTVTGDLGADFFAVGPIQTIPNTSNAGSATLTASITDYTALTASDYEVTYDGANYTLTRLDDGVATNSAAGVFNVDGVQVNVGAGAVAGDSFIVRPTRLGASQIDLLLTRTNDIAAAAPVRTSQNINNLSDASISSPQVTDIGNADLRDTVEIRFNSPATTYDVVNVTDASVISAGNVYSSGADISFNGITVQIDGPAAAGDVFIIENNNSAVSDSTNVITLFNLQTASTVDGNSNYQETYGSLVGKVGTVSRQTQLNAQAQDRLLQDAKDTQQSVSGVNLDEEAIKLTQFQQAYQAAAQVISTSNELFQTLISVVAR